MNIRPRFFINRKTILSDTKKIPTPTPSKRVFITNGPGHTFNEIKSPNIEGSSHFNQQIISEMINSLNLTCHKLWSAQQTFSNRKIIFQATDIAIKVIGVFIVFLMIWVLLSGNSSLAKGADSFSKDFVLLIIIMLIWLTSVSLVIYIYINRYKGFYLDEKITTMINHVLAVYNDGVLKDLEYEAKCDEWATWISITHRDRARNNRIHFGEALSEMGESSQKTENLREATKVQK